MKFGLWTTPPCYSPAPSLLRLCSHPASSQLLPSSSPLSALLCSTLLSSAPALFLPYSSPDPATALLLLCYYPAHSQLHLLSCRTPALLFPNSYPAPSQLLPSSSPATAQLLPSSCLLSIHLCSTKFSSASALFLPYSSPAPASALLLL